MPYLEFEIPSRTWDSTQKEILFALLAQIGFEGFVEGKDTLQAYIDERKHSDQRFNEVVDELAKLGINVQYHFHRTEDQNWNEEWEKKFVPVMIEEKVLIRAPFHDSKDDLPCTLIIEPKMSFGTGHHFTTRLMIMEMMDFDLKQKHILDMGCGTGVLGIYASKMGASGVLAIDNDRWAYQNALENVDRNKVIGMEVRFGDVAALKEEQFDFVLANITRNILVHDLDQYAAHLVEHGILIVSGFLAEDVQFVLNAAYRCKLTHLNTREESNWISLAFKKE